MEKPKKFVLTFFTIILNVFLIISIVICTTYLLDHTSVQSTHLVGPRTEILIRVPVCGRCIPVCGRCITVPSTKPKQLLSGAPLLKTASAYFSRETTRRQIPRTPLRPRERRQKPLARHFNLPNHSKQHWVVCGLSLHQGSTESRKTLENKLFSNWHS